MKLNLGKSLTREEMKTINGGSRDCQSPKPKDHPTNFGEWECHNGQWVWYAELGNQA